MASPDDPWNDTIPEHGEARASPFEEWPKESPSTPAGTIAGFGRLADAIRHPGVARGTRNGARWFAVVILLLVLLPILAGVVTTLL